MAVLLKLNKLLLTVFLGLYQDLLQISGCQHHYLRLSIEWYYSELVEFVDY